MPTSEISWINVKSPIGYFDQSNNILDLIDYVDIL